MNNPFFQAENRSGGINALGAEFAVQRLLGETQMNPGNAQMLPPPLQTESNYLVGLLTGGHAQDAAQRLQLDYQGMQRNPGEFMSLVNNIMWQQQQRPGSLAQLRKDPLAMNGQQAVDIHVLGANNVGYNQFPGLEQTANYEVARIPLVPQVGYIAPPYYSQYQHQAIVVPRHNSFRR